MAEPAPTSDPKPSGKQPASSCRRFGFWTILLTVIVGSQLGLLLYLALRFLPDRPVVYEAAADHFKYGSTGGERNWGLSFRCAPNRGTR